MPSDPPNPEEFETHETGAGAPANSAASGPTDEEMDARERSKARPRRAAGPPLRDDGDDEALRATESYTPPLATDPASEGAREGPPDGELSDGSTAEDNAGLPADHVGPKPSSDELDRRERMKVGPRRAAGPPLLDDGAEEALRGMQFNELPPETNPDN